jgi:hypothetical protein
MDRVHLQKSLKSAIIYGSRRYDLIGAQSYQIFSLQLSPGPIPFINHDGHARYRKFFFRSLTDEQLFRYLHTDFGFYHSRAVELLWECNQLADVHTLETVTARRLADKRGRAEAYAAFGVLWRLTGEHIVQVLNAS